jgi:hypothetical protein
MKTIMAKEEMNNPYKNLLDAVKKTKEDNPKKNIDKYNFNLNDFDEEGNIKK